MGTTTYIQNNFYGNSGYGTSSYNYNRYNTGCYCGCCNTTNYYGGSCFGYGFPVRLQHSKPRHHYNPPVHHHQDCEVPSALKWALGIGVGTTLIGTIVKACSK